ncbi:MAG TPA: peptidoglycan DD-metalloendopeptidase family protein [Acidimicrobiia bacterium]|nr:peptidoglycan DD-metalloendopeptidase family protein [Acidimicrobiia bacterium]
MGGGQFGAVFRVAAIGAVAAVVGIGLLPLPTGAGAAPAPDPKQAANQAAAWRQQLETRYDQLGDQINGIHLKVAVLEARRAELRAITGQRAAVAYKNRDAKMRAMFEATSADDGLRTSQLIDVANGALYQALGDLTTLNAQLTDQRNQIEDQRKQQQDVLDQINAGSEVLYENVAAVMQTLGPPELVDGMICPLPGSAYANDFGAPRSGHTHQGNDMFAPTGTPELAIVNGNVTYGDGGGGGMGAYIAGDDGNRYVYYHLSQYVGPPRHVTAGEVIGKVGSTGDATGPHLHFEIHPAGGAAADPYPTLQRICG